MLEEHSLYLINAGLDGELSPSERNELEALLESSAEARAMNAELLKLNNLIEALPSEAPPQGLAQQILDRAAPRSATTAFSLSGWFSSFKLAPAGFAFAAGLLLTVAFYELTPRHGSPGDTAKMVGSMVTNPQSRGGEQKDSLSLSESGLVGSVSLQSSGGIVVLNFDLESDERIEIEVSFAEAGLSFGGLAHAATSKRIGDESYEISGGVLRVENQGRQAFTVFLPDAARGNGGGRDINIGISSGGARVFTGVLQS